MYVSPNFKSKAEMKRALAAGEKVTVWNPGPFGTPKNDGIETVEGPHFPKPHAWYGQVTVKDGFVVSVK